MEEAKEKWISNQVYRLHINCIPFPFLNDTK